MGATSWGEGSAESQVARLKGSRYVIRKGWRYVIEEEGRAES
jgi:hypothetical protein